MNARTTNLCLLLFAIVSSAVCVQAQVPATTKALVEYDSKLPLNMTQKVLEQRVHIAILDLQFDSPKDGRVNGFLVQPRRAGKSAGIINGGRVRSL